MTDDPRWPAELEALRDEARAAADGLRDMIAAGRDARASLAPAEMLALTRESLRSMESTSPLASDEVIAGVPCRALRALSPDRRGTYLHIHGGGMTVGSPKMNEARNAEIVETHGLDVVSIDYRLAPEHPYPAATDDCLAVARSLIEDDGTGPIVIGGESAGAYLAAVTLLRVRDELDAIDHIVGANLAVGFYDFGATPSHRGVRPTDLPDVLDPTLAAGMRAAYLPGLSIEDTRAPVYSPLYAPLHDLPPALLSTGTADHLLDDSLFMHARWRAWGNRAELALYPDVGHTLGNGMDGTSIAMARAATDRMDEFLASSFA